MQFDSTGGRLGLRRGRTNLAAERDVSVHQPRVARRSSLVRLGISIPRMRRPSASLAFAVTSGWSKYVVAATIALARFKGSSDLNMPDPTNMPSAHQSSLDTPDVWSWIQARTSRACSFGGKIG